LLLLRFAPASTPFPYTTLFRSAVVAVPSASTPQALAVRDLADEHGLGDRVHVVDAVAAPDIVAYLSSASFGVIPIRGGWQSYDRSEEHTSELQSRENLVCRLLL